MNKKKMTFIVTILALIGIVSIIGGTYAFFAYNREGEKENIVTVGKITFRYDEDSVDGINLPTALPMLDYKGTDLTGEGQVFDFTLSTQGTDTLLYYFVNLVMTEDSTLDPDIVKVYLTNVVDGVETSACIEENNTVPTGIGLIGEGYFQPTSETQERHYRLRIWIDKDADFSPLKNEDGTYKTDEDGNYIYPYNNETFKATINVEAGAGFVGDSYCNANSPWETYSCDDGDCWKGSTFTLDDNSTWKIIDQDYAANTVSLIYDHYIDADGNYDVNETHTYACETGGGCGSNQIDVDTALNNFATKIKASLQDENITVSLPSAEMLDVTLKEDYFDAYILHTSSLYFNYKNPYILSDYKLSYDGAKDYYIVGNNKVGLYQEYIIGTYSGLKVGIKPVITISKDYLNN